MGRVISITNQKGGVGKTTTAVNLGASLATLNKKVLIIDIDPQGNATSGVGIDKSEINYCIYDVIVDDYEIEKTIVPTEIQNLNIIPATIQLSGAEIELVSTISRELRLKKAVDSI